MRSTTREIIFMTAPDRCILCRKGSTLDPNLSNAANGRKLGVGKDTVRRHKQHIDEFFNIPNEIITSRKKSVRLEDGSWESVTYQPNAREILEASEDVAKIIGKVFTPTTPVRPSDRRLAPSTKVIAPTDLQTGKVDMNGGTAEMLERVDVSLSALVAEIEDEAPAEVIIADLGDIIENFQNTSAQRETNDLGLTDQILVASATISKIIREVAPLTDRVVYVAVPSNHCEVRIGPKSPASTPSNDFGLMIQEMVRRELSGRPEYAHVVFESPRTKFDIAVAYYSEISNTTFGFAHGDKGNKKAGTLGEWLRDQVAHPDSPLKDVQIMMFGHFHSMWLYQAWGRWIIVAPSSDGGSAWFTNSSGQASLAGILGFNAVNGMWFSPNIF